MPIFAGFLAAIMTFAGPAFGTAVHSLGACESEMTSRDPDVEKLRLEFIREYADKDFGSPGKNEAWIDAALSSSPARRVFLQMENWRIKDLNHSIIKNKDLVTALTNYQKSIWLEEWSRRLPDLETRKYSDFKTERDYFADTGDSRALAAIERCFEAANRRFWSDQRLRRILRAEDLNQPWFALGFGQSADQASLAAKFARETNRKIAYFWQKDVRDHYDSELEKFQALHRELLELLKNKPLLENDGQTVNLKLAVYVAARKSHGDSELHRMLIQQFPGVLITPTVAAKIREFARLADGFTPPLLIKDREQLRVFDAPFGAISLDFLGLGAENIRATARALISAKSLEEALSLARINEQEVTRVFKENQKLIRREFQAFFNGRVSIRFSGDDGIVIPQVEILHSDLIRFLENLSNRFPIPFFRMTLVTKEGASGDSSDLITQGEEIEKKLRALILEEAGLELSNNVTMNVFLFDSGDSRKVVLSLGMRRPLSSDEKKRLNQSFPKAVLDVESEIRMKGSSLRLEPAEIFAVPPEVR
jgi:hypothetical protein